MHMGEAPGEGTAADIRVAVTTITDGTDGRILYQAAGKVGEMTTTGSGTVVALATSPVLTTPLLLNGTTLTWASSTQLSALANGKLTITNNAGTAGGVIDVATDSTFKFFGRDGTTQAILQGGTLALGGATIGSNTLAMTGTANFNGTQTQSGGNYLITSGGSIYSSGNLYLGASSTSITNAITNPSGTIFTWASRNNGLVAWSVDATPYGTLDTFIGRAAAANLQLGAAAVDTAPVAQTLSVQNVLAGGTSNVAGAAFTIAGSQGKGTGVGGNIILQTAPAGSTGTAVNALATVATLYGSGDVGIGSGSAIATSATAGFLLIPTCAGTPTGAPPNAGTGKAAIIFDTTNSQLWVSVSGATWKQPKTPAGAAIVTWQ